MGTFVLYASATRSEALYNPSSNSIPMQASNGYKVAAALRTKNKSQERNHSMEPTPQLGQCQTQDRRRFLLFLEESQWDQRLQHLVVHIFV
jgi:hypothetical protein